MLAQRLRALAAALAVLALGVLLWHLAPWNALALRARYGTAALSFTGSQYLLALAAAYGLALVPAFLTHPAPGASKSLRALAVAGRLLRSPRAVFGSPLAPDDRVAVLATLLKLFFAPLMAMQLLAFCNGALHNGTALLGSSSSLADGLRAAFDRWGFWFLLQLLLFVDVLVFTLGYLVESTRLGNPIRSVDPTLRGWAVTLLCYPPLNLVTSAVLGSAASDFPQFDDTTAHLLLNLLLLGLMAVFAWSSLALGWKASNLTHRGIVARGPYAWVRHPAYTSKNLAWWIGALPVLGVAFEQSILTGLQALLSVAAWTLLYGLRALTEEDHLRSVDGEYAAYAARVRHRFIPGIV